MKNQILLSFVILVFIGACTKKADIKLPESENKLVVTCFITPNDSIIAATVRESKPKFGSAGTGSFSTGYDVNNATVLISDGKQSITLEYDKDFSFYKSKPNQLTILSGKWYYLSVSVPDGRKVEASTLVPEKKLNIESFNFKISKQDSFSLKFTVNAIVNDNPNQVDYMVVYNQTYHSYLIGDSLFDGQNFYNDFAFFDDDEKISKTNFYYDNETELSGMGPIRNVRSGLTVLSCNKEFYLYNKSVQNSGLNGGNPFSDPVMVYTNINNGFGCFGAYIPNNTLKQIK